jgi:hypothetical protein
MSIPGSAAPFLLAQPPAEGVYQIERSLRFNSSDSAYLSRTPASAGNRKTWTWAGWVKLSANSGLVTLFDSFPTVSTASNIIFDGEKLRYADYNGGYTSTVTSSAVFRDFSAWYHIVCSYDSPQATASNRVKLYVNGGQVTQLSASSYPSQNYDSFINTTSGHGIGGRTGGQYLLNGLLADIHFIDSQALTPSAFGEFDTNNVWQPKAYTGSYGTNGFHLDFADNSAATAAALGKDTSGNGNNWTPNNLSVTAGAGNDSLVDSPTNYGTDTGAGGEVRGNYATLNPLAKGSTTFTVSNGNLDYSAVGDGVGLNGIQGTFGNLGSGKWYFEATLTANSGGDFLFGWSNQNWTPSVNPDGNPSAWYLQGNVGGNVVKENGGSSAQIFASYANSDVFMICIDIDASKIWFGKNGTWSESGVPASGTNAQFTNLAGSGFTPFARGPGAGSGTSFVLNFGQRPFAYTAPSGFKALCTTNLPTPTIEDGSTAMDVKLYTGNGSTQTISGLNFSPDFVWIKARNVGSYHLIVDKVRDVAGGALASNSTDPENTPSSSTAFSAFTSDGFTVGDNADWFTNRSSQTYVAWAWDAGTSTVTNTQGSITSQVRANASAGFSVVTWTGNGTAGATVGHGLGAKPFLRIIKRRDAASTIGWMTFHESAPSSYFTLNSTNAATPASEAAPTSTVFSLPADVNSNASGGTYVAYCFAPVAGYSSFGSYTGNGSADGPFVYTGHRSRFLMVKRTDSDNVNTAHWFMYDSARNPSNVTNNWVAANLSNAEAGTSTLDLLSNGFKWRDTGSAVNANGGTYIWASFAESPFAYSRAR